MLSSGTTGASPATSEPALSSSSDLPCCGWRHLKASQVSDTVSFFLRGLTPENEDMRAGASWNELDAVGHQRGAGIRADDSGIQRAHYVRRLCSQPAWMQHEPVIVGRILEREHDRVARPR